MQNLCKQLRALALVVSLVSPVALWAAHVDTRPSATRPRTKITESAKARRRISRLRQSRRRTASGKSSQSHTARLARRHRHRYHERFYTSSYATDTLNGDITEGEDATVRAAAIDALGNMNGTVTAIDPNSGRILAMVNQKLALSAGAQPCSTIKVPVALAALSEGIVTKDTEIPLGRYSKMNMTTALARSNNAYFEALGRKLGFARVHRYSQQFGLGELAGYDIPGEHRGVFPTTEISEKLGGVGKMCSFGEGISMTPLQLGALVSAIANGNALWNGSPSASELQRRRGSGKDRHVFARGNPLWLVCLVREHGCRRYRNCGFSARRAAHLWPQGCGDCREDVSRFVRSQLLRGQGDCAEDS